MKNILVLTLAACCFSVFAAKSDSQVELQALDKFGRSLVSEGCSNRILVKKTSVKNKYYPDVFDEITEHRCPTFKTIKYIAKSAKPFKELPLRAEVSANTSRMPKRYAIGASVLDVERTLGLPSKKSKDRTTYELEAEGPGGNTITFVHRQNTITSVVWSWDVW